MNRDREAHLLDDGKHPWLVVVIPVCADTEVDLLRESIILVCGGQLEDTTIKRVNALSGDSRRSSSTPIGRGERNLLPCFCLAYTRSLIGQDTRLMGLPAETVPDIVLFDGFDR